MLIYLLCLVVFLASHITSQGDLDDDRIEMHCDPRQEHRFQHCPDGYCCVRDEFLPHLVFCQRIGAEGADCTTRFSESNCPCAAHLYCRPNVESETITSLYGRCSEINLPEEGDN